MAVVSDRVHAGRMAESRVRTAADGDVRRLEADRERLTDELGLRSSRLYSGEGREEDVRAIEAELDELERDLRRARAARAYVS